MEDSDQDDVTDLVVRFFTAAVSASHLFVLDALEREAGVIPFLLHAFVPELYSIAQSGPVVGFTVGVWCQAWCVAQIHLVGAELGSLDGRVVDGNFGRHESCRQIV